LIIGGLHTRLCLAFAVIEALKECYDVMFVGTPSGGRSQVAHRTAIARMSPAGAVPNTALAVRYVKLFRYWSSPLADRREGHLFDFAEFHGDFRSGPW